MATPPPRDHWKGEPVSISLGDEPAVRERGRRRGANLLIGLGLGLVVVASSACTTTGAAARPPASATATPSAADDSIATPTLEVVSTPTPVPTPPMLTDEQLAGACSWAAVPGAAKYSGKVHPLVVAFADNGWYVDAGYRYSINSNWYTQTWSGPIQLIVCVGPRTVHKIGSCGTYKSASGQVGTLYRYKFSETVRVAYATTGKTLQSKTFYGSTPACGKQVHLDDNHAPPWQVYGTEVSDSAVNAYATAVSTQK